MSSDWFRTEDDVSWIESYQTSVVDTFTTRFQSSDDRFTDGRRLIDQFLRSVESVLQNGRKMFSRVDEAHNELCLAYAILSNPDPTVDRLEYEPKLAGTKKTIDLRASLGNGRTVYVDIKTIKPRPRDRWEQYQRAEKEGWFPENVQVGLENNWLGGELWHNMFAARSRMLEYAVELETKIAKAELTAEVGTDIYLALCSDGEHWCKDEYEDFVDFYRTGHHRGDDPFERMEAKYIKDKGISLTRSITRFAYMRCTQGDIDLKRLDWNVRPPTGIPKFS